MIAYALTLFTLLPQDVADAAYRAQLAAAESAMRLGEHADARGWLDATEPARRGFEWRVHDAELDQSLQSFAVDVGVGALAMTPDGRFVVCGHTDGTLSLRDPVSFAAIAGVKAHAEAITQVRSDRDSQRIVTCSYDRTVKIWNVADLSPAVEFRGHGFPVGGADFSADGTLVASCSYERQPGCVVGTLHLWNAEDGTIVRTLRGGRKPLVGLSFSPDGERIAAGSWDFCVFVWNASGGEPVQLAVPEEGIYNAVDGAAWSADGTLVAGASKDRTARVWNATTGALVATLRGHTDSVAKLAFAPNGETLATASRDGTLRLWNVADWRERATLLGHADDVVDLAFSADGGRLWSCATDGTVRVWDAATTWYGSAAWQNTAATYIARFSPDGHRLATCSYDGRVQVWSADNRELLVAWQAHANGKSCHALDWSPDGRLLFSGSWDGSVRIWDSVTQAERGVLQHDDGVAWLDVSADGRLVAAVSGAKVFVWDIAERRLLQTFAGHGSSVLNANFDPASTHCVSSARDGKAVVWDARTGEVRCTITGVGPDVAESVFTADGAQVVVGGRGGRVALFSAADGQLVRDLVRNRHGFDHLMLSPDGQRLALASHVVTFVDVAHGGVVGHWRPHRDQTHQVAFDATGNRLASCSGDGSIAIADVAPLRDRLAHAADWQHRLAEVERQAGDLTDIGAAADRVFADATLNDERRAAWIEVLTRAAR